MACFEVCKEAFIPAKGKKNHTIFYPKDKKIYRLKNTGEIGPLISPFIFQSGPIKIQMNSGKKPLDCKFNNGLP